MITQKVEEVIARYKSSSNTDKKNDYVRVMEYINTNVDLNDAERRKIEFVILLLICQLQQKLAP